MNVMRIAAAATLYFLSVFGAGFLFGTVRVLLVEPRLGSFYAVLCEAPFLLFVIVVASRWAPRAVGVPPQRGALVLVGLGALIMQQLADVIVGVTLRDLTLPEQFARFATAEGVVYAAMLTLFAIMPTLTNKTSGMAQPLA
jgi:hypothetical protein